jgi:hypothetical protein
LISVGDIKVEFLLAIGEESIYVQTTTHAENNEHPVIMPVSHPEIQAATAKRPYTHEFAEKVENRVEKKTLEVAIHQEIVKQQSELPNLTVVAETIHHDTIKPIKAEPRKIDIEVTKQHEVIVAASGNNLDDNLQP